MKNTQIWPNFTQIQRFNKICIEYSCDTVIISGNVDLMNN